MFITTLIKRLLPLCLATALWGQSTVTGNIQISGSFNNAATPPAGGPPNYALGTHSTSQKFAVAHVDVGPNVCDWTSTDTLANCSNNTGVNTIVTPGTFGPQQVIRTTDKNTSCATITANVANLFATADDGLPTLWATDSSSFVIKKAGSQRCVQHFNTGTLQVTGGSAIALDAAFTTYSSVSANVLYQLSGTDNVTIKKHTMTLNANPSLDSDSVTTIKDLGADANCFGASYTANWTSLALTSFDDTAFTVGASTGVQNTGFLAVNYNTGTAQCTVINTQTRAVTVNGVSQGTYGIPDTFFLHDVYQTPNPRYALLATPSNGFYVWDINNPTTLTHCGGAYSCAGHFVPGRNGVFTDKSVIYHSFADPSTPLTVNLPSPPGYPDSHASYRNVDASDTHWVMYDAQNDAGDVYSQLGVFPSALWNEIWMVKPDGSNSVSRQLHTYSTGWSGTFDALSAIGSISQDGKYVLWTSDWMCELGNTAGSGTTFCGGPNWQKNDSGDFVVNSKIEPTSGNANNSVFQITSCSGTCTTGSTAPTWPQTTNSTVTDNNITWKNIGQVNTRIDVFIGVLQ